MIVQHATRREWLEDRLRGIGGSDAPAVLRIPDAYGSPYSVWASRVFPTPIDDKSTPGTPMDWGLRFERAIAECACDAMGWDLVDLRAPGAFCASVVMDDAPYMRSTPDFFVRRRSDAAIGALQVKNVDVSKGKQWSDGRGPLPYEVQLQHEMFTSLATETPPTFGALAACVGGNQLVVLERELDTPLIEDWIDEAARFWKRVETRTPPPVDGKYDTLQAAKRIWKIRDNGQVKTFGPEWQEIYRERERMDAAKRAAQERLNEIDAAALEELGGAERAIIPGAGRVQVISVQAHTKPPVAVEAYSYPRWYAGETASKGKKR